MNKENTGKKNMCKTICTQCKYIRIDTEIHQNFYRDEEGDYLCTAYPIITMDCIDNTEHTTCSKCKDKNKGCCKKYKVDTERKKTQSLITQLEKIIKKDINRYSYGSYYDDTKELIIQDAINIIKGERSDILTYECYKCDDCSCETIVTREYYDKATKYYKREQEYKKKEQERKKRSRW